MSLQQRSSLRLEQTIDGFGDSIFPKVDELLESLDYQKAIKHVGFQKGPNYRSIVDALFCAMFPKYIKSCVDFYEGDGEQLRFLVTETEIEDFEKVLLCALKMAVAKHQAKDETTWIIFYSKVVRTQKALNNPVVARLPVYPG